MAIVLCCRKFSCTLRRVYPLCHQRSLMLLVRHCNISLLGSLNALILSDRANETASEELLELLGYDAIELIMEILTNRQILSREVRGLSECCGL